MNLEAHPQLTLRQLWHFAVAAESGTVAEAARRLHMAPSAVSMSISELERIVGADLAIRRRAKGLTLTATGRSVLRQARSLLELAGEIESLGSVARGQLSGPLTVGCLMPLGPTIIPPMLAAFAEQFPLVEVDFIEGFHADMQQALLEGSVDVAFLYGADISPSLNSATVTMAPAFVLLPTTHPLAAQDRIELGQLANDQLVLYESEPLTGRILSLYEGLGIEPLVRHRSRSYATVRALVGSGRGVAILYQQAALEAPYQELQVVLKPLVVPPGQAAGIPVTVAWPRSLRLSHRAQAWVQMATELFRQQLN